MSNDMIPLLTKALGETVYMVAVSMAIASALGIPLGVLLYATDKGQILESKTKHLSRRNAPKNELSKKIYEIYG